MTTSIDDLIKERLFAKSNVHMGENPTNRFIPFECFDPKVQILMKHPYHEQGSPKWFEERKTLLLTASEVGSVLEDNEYRTRELTFDEKIGKSSSSFDNDATRHGNKYESEAAEIYRFVISPYFSNQSKNSRIVEEPLLKMSLIKSSKYPFLGASCDRVTPITGLCNLFLSSIEI